MPAERDTLPIISKAERFGHFAVNDVEFHKIRPARRDVCDNLKRRFEDKSGTTAWTSRSQTGKVFWYPDFTNRPD
jgi:hypothetical protein